MLCLNTLFVICMLTLSHAGPDPAAALATRLDVLRREHHIPGLAVVVLHGPKTVLARGYGFANIEKQIPVTPDTPFDIASVSKPVSAVVALRLSELGKVDLDARMDSFIGFTEFAEAARKSGGVFFGDYATGPTPLTLRHVLMMQANGNPGTRFWYNPPSYSWASCPLAQAASKPFSDLVAEYVFRPAGMTRSVRRHRGLAVPPTLATDLARPYHRDEKGHMVPSELPGPQGDGASGGVVSTAADLARFDRALEAGTLLTAKSREAMWSPGRSPSGEPLPYGVGWFVKDVGGERMMWHTGIWEGKYSALYLKVPTRKLTIILLANSDGLQWETRFDEAAIERSLFATAVLAAFPR